MAGPSSPFDKQSKNPFGITNIKSYIPFTLDLEKLNYDAWRELFGTRCIGFHVLGHLDGSSLPFDPLDVAWRELDSIVKLWLYGTISQDFLSMILKNNTIAREIKSIANLLANIDDSVPERTLVKLSFEQAL
ncbi:hypothetical protein OSB04_000997 [Centaurea solstitialis]|uniref:Uncharacterized protein n=1 Tax=Centaurea solstitialis TaxID=347529 RepID=A0AA38U0S0_9ASTR|nr:hypothetical protein OSB04_000997 [Centaurea solstitialis]